MDNAWAVGRTVLIVDDEESIRKMLGRCLTRWGFQVAFAEDGREAWQMLQDGAYDLVITDNSMPVMRGEELARQVKVKYPGMPVIMLTALNAFPGPEGGKPPGVDFLLLKPASLEDVRRVLRRALS
ncbi:MAG: response regulator [Kiritimatiellae bacterium]|nr:response regulator [Kiritimatiellia bacterium]